MALHKMSLGHLVMPQCQRVEPKERDADLQTPAGPKQNTEHRKKGERSLRKHITHTEPRDPTVPAGEGSRERKRDGSGGEKETQGTGHKGQ